MTAMLIVLGTLPIVEAWRDPRGGVRLAGATASFALVSAVQGFPVHPAGACVWFLLASGALALVARARVARV